MMEIYHFKLNNDSTELVLPNSLEPKFLTSLYVTGMDKIYLVRDLEELQILL